MRILMLAQFYPPIIGGEERFVRDLSVELASRGHQVSVATLAQEGLSEFEIDQGVRVYRLPSTMSRIGLLHSDAGRRHATPFPDPETSLALRGIVARERPDIIHAYNWLIHSFLPLKYWSKAKLVLSVCDHSFICPKKKLIYHDEPCTGPGLTKCLGCSVEHYGLTKGVVTAVSNRIANVFEQKLVDMFLPVSWAVADGNLLLEKKVPFQVLPNFVADDVAQPHGESEPYLKQLPSEDYLLYVGAFGRYKGVDVLLKAYSELANLPPLVIIGYDTNEYPVQTTDLPPNVTILRNWPNFAVLEAWRRSMIALVPSMWAEPFGIVVLEAMATGRPVIASRIGALSDIVVDGETGLLFPPGDIEELKQAIQKMVADPTLRQRMGEAGKHRLVEFQASTVVPRYEQVYLELIQSKELARSHKAVEMPKQITGFLGSTKTEKELIEL